MGDLSKNISRHEVACKCHCGFDTLDIDTAMIVQGACDYFAMKLDIPRVALIITSGCRCLGYNRTVGSTDGSQHPKGRALDIKILEVSPEDVYAYFTTTYPDRFGFGKYDTFTHVDTRTNGPARW